MPAKNKPKRLDRARSWRVARRKKKKALAATGSSRSRAKRPKKKGKVTPKLEVKVVKE